MRTVWRLVEDRPVEIEMETPVTHIRRRTVEQMPATEVTAVLREAAMLKTREDRLPNGAGGEVGRECCQSSLARTCLNQAARWLSARWGMDDVNHSDEAGRAE